MVDVCLPLGLRVFEENIWTRAEDMTGGWRKLNNEFHNLYPLPSTIRMVKENICRLLVGKREGPLG
jgi:hypothetical protein